MKRWLTLGILVVIAFLLGYLLSRPRGTEVSRGKPNAFFLIHVYSDGTSCKAVVGPKRAEILEQAGAQWDLRNDCNGQTVSSFDVRNFRRKGQMECDQDNTQGDPNDSPVEDVVSGPGNSKHTKVKRGAAHGEARLAYCYDVTVNLGSGPVKADPEMDIMP